MISNISDKIVFNALKNIKYGRIYLTNFMKAIMMELILKVDRL